MRAPCRIDGCDKESRGRGLCATHWARWRKYGDPLFVKQRGIDWQVRRTCSVEDCDRPHHAHSYCTKHLERWQKHGDPNHVEPITGRPLKGDVPTFTAVHKRLGRALGPAKSRACIDCGGPAAEWSYDGHDAEELVDPKSGSAYSLDLDHYDPRCVSCHRRFDGAGLRPRDERGTFRAVTA